MFYNIGPWSPSYIGSSFLNLNLCHSENSCIVICAQFHKHFMPVTYGLHHVTLTEGEGSVQLTSSLR
jgi:hypothetical protein